MVKYVIGQSDKDEVKYFNNIYDYLENSEIAIDDGGPCYQWHLRGVQDLEEDLPVSVFIKALFSGTKDDEMELITFSVTSKEPRYKEWIEVAQSYPGSGCTTIKRGTGKHAYQCYFVTIPHPRQFKD